MLNKISLSEALKRSCLTPGQYIPSENIKKIDNICLFAGDNLVLALGPTGDARTLLESNLLTESSGLKRISSPEYPEHPITIKVVNGKNIPWKDKENAVVISEPGKVEEGNNDGDLQWIVFGNNSLSIATALCINEEIQKISKIEDDPFFKITNKEIPIPANELARLIIKADQKEDLV